MKFSAIKKIDNLGRIVIPRDIRDYYDIELNDFVKIMPTSNGILIMKNSNEQQKDDNAADNA